MGFSSSNVDFRSLSKLANGDLVVTPPDLNAYAGGTVEVRCVEMYRQQVAGEMGILHGFVLISVGNFAMPDGSIFSGFGWIFAERTFTRGRGQVNILTMTHFRPANCTSLYRVCTRDAIIRVIDLIDVLRAPTPDYDLFFNNCWAYQHDVARGVLVKLKEQNPRHLNLQAAVATFPEYQRPINVKAVLRYAVECVETILYCCDIMVDELDETTKRILKCIYRVLFYVTLFVPLVIIGAVRHVSRALRGGLVVPKWLRQLKRKYDVIKLSRQSSMVCQGLGRMAVLSCFAYIR